MVRTRRTRLFTGAIALGIVALMVLPACEPGDAVPILRTAEAQADGVTVHLSWPAVRNTVTSYEIWYRPTGTTTWVWSSTGDVGENYRSWVPVVAGTTEYVRDFRATGLTAGGTYDISVRSVAATSSFALAGMSPVYPYRFPLSGCPQAAHWQPVRPQSSAVAISRWTLEVPSSAEVTTPDGELWR